MSDETIRRIATVSMAESSQWGCVRCGCRNGLICNRTADSVLWQCSNPEGCEPFVVLRDGTARSSLGFYLDSGEMFYPVLQDHPRRGTPAHG